MPINEPILSHRTWRIFAAIVAVWGVLLLLANASKSLGDSPLGWTVLVLFWLAVVWVLARAIAWLTTRVGHERPE